MKHQTSTIETTNGLHLFTQSWLPDGDPKAIVVFSHGIGEHSGRYAHIGQALADHGYGLCMDDLRGHGQSAGKRGHIDSWGDYRSDFMAIYDDTHTAYPGIPVFAGGHSLGGLIALNAAVVTPNNCAGIIASGAGLGLAFVPPQWKVSLAKTLSNLTPALAMSNEINPDWLSRDRAVVEAYRSDPLVHDRITARCFVEFTAAQEETMSKAGNMTLPLYLIGGAEDQLTSTQAIEKFYTAAGSKDKTLKIYEGLYHEVFNELEQETVIGDLITWLDQHLDR
ncbi:MAG: lysophospholipase [Anaerolineae bacterium]|nr:lysophospholipase [Anaerolineae bacterium]